MSPPIAFLYSVGMAFMPSKLFEAMTEPIVPLMMITSAGTLKKAGSCAAFHGRAQGEPDERDDDSDCGGGLHDRSTDVIGTSRQRFRAVQGI